MFKNALKLKKMSTKEVCIIAMLIAVTVVLSFISGYLRTPVGKLNISFVSVYVCAAMFGPLAGGLVGALADLISGKAGLEHAHTALAETDISYLDLILHILCIRPYDIRVILTNTV